MANLKRNLKPRQFIGKDQAAWIHERMSSADWVIDAGRKLKARKLPWRSMAGDKGLSFKGKPLWPSQLRYMANRMRSVITDTIKESEGKQPKKESREMRELRKKKKDLREMLKGI